MQLPNCPHPCCQPVTVRWHRQVATLADIFEQWFFREHARTGCMCILALCMRYHQAGSAGQASFALVRDVNSQLTGRLLCAPAAWGFFLPLPAAGAGDAAVAPGGGFRTAFTLMGSCCSTAVA